MEIGAGESGAVTFVCAVLRFAQAAAVPLSLFCSQNGKQMDRNMVQAQESAEPGGASMMQSVGMRIAGDYLIFRLGAVEYGVNTLKVQEIRSCDRFLRMVRGPRHLLGVLDWRGVEVPIIDLRIRFGMQAVSNDRLMTIVLDLGGRAVGLVVDDIAEVVSVQSSDVLPAADVGGPLRGAYVSGIATVGDDEVERTIVLLEIEELMAGTAMGLRDARSL